jgi:hypothetical protein
VRYRHAFVLVAACALTALVLWVASKPVLLHTHILTTPDYRSCGAYNEEGTGVTLLNPLRSRGPERVADRFMRALSKGMCAPEVGDKLCTFLKQHPLSSSEWRLANRTEFGRDTHIFYRLGLETKSVAETKECIMAKVTLTSTGAGWEISGYGVSW